MSSVGYPHLSTDDRGVVHLAGTRVKVTDVVVEHVRWLLDARQIHAQHPDLSPASIHSALAYYYDHQAEVDAAIADEWAAVERSATDQPMTPLQLRLREATQVATAS